MRKLFEAGLRIGLIIKSRAFCDEAATKLEGPYMEKRIESRRAGRNREIRRGTREKE